MCQREQVEIVCNPRSKSFQKGEEHTYVCIVCAHKAFLQKRCDGRKLLVIPCDKHFRNGAQASAMYQLHCSCIGTDGFNQSLYVNLELHEIYHQSRKKESLIIS